MVSIVLACGLATPWIFTYYHSPLIYMYWESFLLQGLLARFADDCFLACNVNSSTIQAESISIRKLTCGGAALPFWVSGVLMIIASIPFAYESLLLSMALMVFSVRFVG